MPPHNPVLTKLLTVVRGEDDQRRLGQPKLLEAGPGRPAGLLIERLAAAAERAGVALWIPNVDGAKLQFLLRLPGELWVDGPAVPEAD